MCPQLNNGDDDDDEQEEGQLRHTWSADDSSSESSTADMTYQRPEPVTSSAELQTSPPELRDAFGGDLRYVDERVSGGVHLVPAAVFQSSSSPSSSSDVEHRNTVSQFTDQSRTFSSVCDSK